MARLWRQIIKGEEGQVLPIVLILLVVGGLIIAPTLNHASTSLNAGQIVEENVRGVYAAEAGVEDALWRLRNDPLASYPHSYQLPENVNQMQVAIDTDELGDYVLYYGELTEAKKHYFWLAVDGQMEWIEEEEAYEYTITVTWQVEPGEPNIKLTDVGVRLPVGYGYEEDSAADPEFADNLSSAEPDDTLDGADAHMLNWDFPKPEPVMGDEYPIATQTFYVTGEGELEGDYAWIVSKEKDIKAVGEASGPLYQITATATSDSGSSTTIEAYTLVNHADEYDYYEHDLVLVDETYIGNVYAGNRVKLEENAILYGNAIAENDVELKEEGATIDGSVCAGHDVKLEKDGATIYGDVYAGNKVELKKEGATIIGDVYAGGNVELKEEGVMIDGDVYAEGNVTYKNRDDITGEIDEDYEYERCGLSLNEGLQILSWQINPQED